ncbi:sigma-70 family RNA polymerase sigma factor [Arthrobacter sp. H41]|uniref:sigma-70 family RNA polymerase sigma factor n=1 Tax=Arthrobacter sp. H41 TaxID=1312978 RepID=UPI0004ADE0A0|nr:sigma-70 family RNA polymerase sigma factor [Arthrobacter sp. H41]
MTTAPLPLRTRVGRLLARTAAGDQDAFAELYRVMSSRVYRLAQQMVVDSDLSQEITQDVFLQVWQKAHTFEASKGPPVAWLMMITHRRALDRARAEHTSSNRNAAYAVATYTPDFDQTAETAINRLEEQDITRSLKTLSATQRESINLAYYDGLTYQQVGAHLGIPLATAKTRIRDGLIRLKSSMEHT